MRFSTTGFSIPCRERKGKGRGSGQASPIQCRGSIDSPHPWPHWMRSLRAAKETGGHGSSRQGGSGGREEGESGCQAACGLSPSTVWVPKTPSVNNPEQRLPRRHVQWAVSPTHDWPHLPSSAPHSISEGPSRPRSTLSDRTGTKGKTEASDFTAEILESDCTQCWPGSGGTDKNAPLGETKSTSVSAKPCGIVENALRTFPLAQEPRA